MRFVKIASVATAAAGIAAAVIIASPSVFGQAPRPNPDARPDPGRRIEIFGGGQSIGASVRDVEASDAQRAGVVVEEVRPGGAAEKAGLRRGDVITKFDGETVRSVRQFSRLVQETAPGRAVATTVMREGRATDLSVTPGVTPGTGPRAGVFIDRDRAGRPFDQQRLDDQMERLRDRLRDLPFDFNFDVEPPQFEGRPRLGVTVQTLTPQLAAYFGAKNGVLVADVANDSAAAQAGLKAGDVITSVNGRDVLSRSDLTRALNEAGTTGEVTIGIVRDKKTTSVKAKLEDARPPRRESRPVRPVRATPAWPRTEPAGRPRQAEAMRLVSARGAAGKEAASIPVSCAANSEASA